MPDFIRSILGFAVDPLVLGLAAFVGYLFYAQMTKLAWSLLLFVLPGLGSVGSVGSHGVILDGVAEFLAASMLTLVFYRSIEAWAMRRRAGNA